MKKVCMGAIVERYAGLDVHKKTVAFCFLNFLRKIVVFIFAGIDFII